VRWLFLRSSPTDVSEKPISTERYIMVENLTKLEVATRQLKEAIWLFFNQHDSIAIHTLVAAAHQVLHDLAKDKGIFDIKNNPLIREEKKGYWLKRLSEAENYFKHAERDPAATLEFPTDLTQIFLIDALHLHQQLTKSIFPEAFVYGVWFARKYPDTIAEGVLKTIVSTAEGQDLDFDDFAVMSTVLSAFRLPDA